MIKPVYFIFNKTTDSMPVVNWSTNGTAANKVRANSDLVMFRTNTGELLLGMLMVNSCSYRLCIEAEKEMGMKYLAGHSVFVPVLRQSNVFSVNSIEEWAYLEDRFSIV